MTGDVGLYVGAGGFHSHTGDDDEQHEEETLHATKYIDDLGNDERKAATERSCHYASDVQETVCTECRGDEGVERGVNAILQESDEFDKVNATRTGQSEFRDLYDTKTYKTSIVIKVFVLQISVIARTR